MWKTCVAGLSYGNVFVFFQPSRHLLNSRSGNDYNGDASVVRWFGICSYFSRVQHESVSLDLICAIEFDAQTNYLFASRTFITQNFGCDQIPKSPNQVSITHTLNLFDYDRIRPKPIWQNNGDNLLDEIILIGEMILEHFENRIFVGDLGQLIRTILYSNSLPIDFWSLIDIVAFTYFISHFFSRIRQGIVVVACDMIYADQRLMYSNYR